jgi:hypothetical protein
MDKRNEFFDKLNDCIMSLEDTDYRTVKQYIDLYCAEEKDDIIMQFKKEFRNVPDDNPLKIETLEFLGRLGIIVYN